MPRTSPLRASPDPSPIPTSQPSSPSAADRHLLQNMRLEMVEYPPPGEMDARPATPPSSARLFRRTSSSSHSDNHQRRARRMLTRRMLCIALMLVGIIYLWRTGVAREDRAASPSSDTDTFGPSATDGLQFFPASNPKIHYVGRWMAAPNRMRMDGTFPGTTELSPPSSKEVTDKLFVGVYLDISVNITSTVLLALSNAAAAPATLLAPAVSSSAMDKVVTPNVGHLSFRPSSLYQPPAPISLLARVDQEEYILLPNATSLIAIRLNDLDPNNPHEIRVIAPMAGTLGDSILAVKGIWLDQGGQLLRLPGSPLPAEFDDEDALHAGSQGIREEHLRGLDRLKQDDRPSRPDGEVDEATLGDAAFERSRPRRILEMVTDDLGLSSYSAEGRGAGGGRCLLGGVMSWEYLVGEMFGVDHVATAVDGMCLTRDCIGGVGSPAGLSDVFFRSGPPASPYFARPWIFQEPHPDLVVINIGASDFRSFEKHRDQYNLTSWDFSQRFEDDYVSFVKAIRRLAYPKETHQALASNPGSTDHSSSIRLARIPIYVLRPFQGLFEDATQNVVERIRADGDGETFWIDTNGWLNLEDTTSEERHFVREDVAGTSRWRLTSEGSRRVAVFLHMHLCQHLAQDVRDCPFQRPDVYQGQAFDPDVANLDRYLKNEKERRLHELFWGDE